MTPTYTITVTQDDINNGLPCPIAQAMERSGFQDSHVGNIGTHWVKDGRESFATLPKEAQDFVEAFDKGYTVQPFSFTVTEVAGRDV